MDIISRENTIDLIYNRTKHVLYPAKQDVLNIYQGQTNVISSGGKTDLISNRSEHTIYSNAK